MLRSFVTHDYYNLKDVFLVPIKNYFLLIEAVKDRCIALYIIPNTVLTVKVASLCCECLQY